MRSTATAIVTGASKGIGYALTLNLAQRGIDVFAVARSEDELNKLKSNYPERINIVVADISAAEGRNKIIQKIGDCGITKIDFLVNNAAVIGPLKNLEEITEDEFQNLLNINLYAAVFLSSKLLPFLTGGRILNVSSAAEGLPTAGAGLYAISKAALKMATRVQQLEYSNVAVNSVIPGEVETNMQVELRNSDHPLKQTFKECAESGSLMPASTCAAFLAYLLLEVNEHDFKNNEWEIYDLKHRNYWLKDKMLLPPPYACVQAAKENQKSPCSFGEVNVNHVFTLHGQSSIDVQSLQQYEEDKITNSLKK